jgi:ElaB/YqjD/DUF883 family membrane-anchored ribosome-binding protein
MPSDHADLSSVASTLDEVTRRVTAAADRHAGARREDLAADLYEVERALRTAGRRLAKVLRERG